MNIKKLLLLFLFFTFTNFPNAPAANLTGQWWVGDNCPPQIGVIVNAKYVWRDGGITYSTYNWEVSPSLSPLSCAVTADADGPFSGGATQDSGRRTESISGVINGNLISFKRVQTLAYSDGKKTIKVTQDCVGTIDSVAQTASGTLTGTYEEHNEEDYGGTCYIYRDIKGSFSGTFQIVLQAYFNTFIDAKPPSESDQPTVIFVWRGTGGNGGIAGYYYQIDTQTKVYTTAKLIMLNDLSVGTHTFSVAAKDNAGNIDPTPAKYTFSIKNKAAPNPGESSTLGPSTNPRQAVGDPINVITGNMYVHTSDFSLPGIGMGFDFTRTYNSRDTYSGPLGYGWTHSYNILLTADTINKLITIKDGQGREIVFADDENGGWLPQRGEHSTLTKTVTGYTWRKKDGIQYFFNVTGKLSQITDRNANSIILSYDGSSNLIQITDTAGRLIKFTYNAKGRIVSMITPAGSMYRYFYDVNDNLFIALYPKASYINYKYDENHNLIQKSDPRRNSVFFTYNSTDRCTSSYRTDNYEKVSLSFIPALKITLVTDALGNRTIYYYNFDFQLTKIMGAQKNQMLSTWDTNLNLTSSTDALGRVTSFQYDTLGNLTQLTDPLGNITKFTYEPTFSNLTSVTNALGFTTTYTYTKGNLTKIVDALGKFTFYLYNTKGQVTNIVDSNFKRFYFTYDAQGNLSGTRDQIGVTVGFTYDTLGNKISSTDPRGNVTQYSYDLLSRLVKITYPDNTIRTFIYDGMDNLISEQDALLNTTTYTYDPASKRVSATDALKGVVVSTYDLNGNLITVKDQNNNQTTFEYDSLNRLVSKTNALNFKWYYVYDPIGNLIQERTPQGGTINYTYDELNRLKTINSSAGEVRYNYDVLGRRIFMTDWQGTTNYTYDALNRLIQADGPLASGDTIQYSFDSIGRRSKMIDYNNKTTTYAYDAAGKLISINDDKGFVAKYAYDAYGNIASTIYPNNTEAIYTYDSLNRLTRVTNRLTDTPNTTLAVFNYAYDQLGRKTRAIASDGIVLYSYDALSRLVSDRRIGKVAPYQIIYSYDPAGNRLVMSKNGIVTNYSYNQLNQLISEAGAAPVNYSYDNNGNLIKSTGNGKVQYYTYDALNRLNRILGTGIFEYYKYDGQGRRVQSVNILTKKQLNYFYDGGDAILERDAQGATVNSWTRNPYASGGIGGIVKGLSPVGTVPEQYYHYDGLGSVAATSGASGTKINSYVYDSFGNIQGQSPAGTVPGFLTKEQSSASGLVYFGARYYDPRLGRFITQDPMEMIDGPNLYLYCRNDPINWVDPWGLCEKNKKATAEFKWYDPTSWVFPGTNYCGITKSGPGIPISSTDSCCQRHDVCIRDAKTAWWNPLNRKILNCHDELTECLYDPELYNNN